MNDYVLYGSGEARTIMSRELQNVYRFFNNQEMLDLIEWMREYNRTHEEKVQFIGTDIGFAGASAFDRVTEYVDDERPQLTERIRELYANLRPADDAEAFDYMRGYQARPMDERTELAEQADTAHELLAEIVGDYERGALALHDAWTIARTAQLYVYDMTDPEQAEQQYRLRDRTMADNVVWWREHTGDRILLSAQNGHVGYVSHHSTLIPKPQGALLRDELGRDYVNVGFTFDHGSFYAFGPETFFGPDRPVPERHSVPAAEPASSEHVLNQVRFDDYVVDLRRVPGPARRWLDEQHPTRNVGLFWPEPDVDVSLRETCDVLIHLDATAADRRRCTGDNRRGSAWTATPTRSRPGGEACGRPRPPAQRPRPP